MLVTEIDPLKAFGLLEAKQLGDPAPEELGRDRGVLQGPPAKGERIADRFLLLESIGRGGMGEVFRARDEELEREVALKVLAVSGKDAQARFAREAEATARISHPNVIRIHQSGRVRGHHYLVYELIEDARNLRTAFEGRSLDERLDLLEDVARGLAAAHALGVVHRDLKPENVLVRADGSALVADFGLARLDRSSLTKTGNMLGTPAYMAPEQVRGERAQPQADVWALGLLLYEALYDRHPFDPETVGIQELLARILEGRALYPPGAPAPLRSLVQACLSQDQSARPNDAGAFLTRLRAARQATTTPPWGWALLAVCLFVIGLVALQPRPDSKRTPASPPTTKPDTPPPTRPQTSTANSIGLRTWKHPFESVKSACFVGEDHLILVGRKDAGLFDLEGRRVDEDPLPPLKILKAGATSAFVGFEKRTHRVTPPEPGGEPTLTTVLDELPLDIDPATNQALVSRGTHVELRDLATGEIVRKVPVKVPPRLGFLTPSRILVAWHKPVTYVLSAPREGEGPFIRPTFMARERLTSVATSPDRLRIALGSSNGVILLGHAGFHRFLPLERMRTPGDIKSLAVQAHLGSVRGMCFLSDRFLSYTRSRQSKLELVVWDPATLEAEQVLQIPDVRTLSVSLGGRIVVVRKRKIQVLLDLSQLPLLH